jgi:hypothetical protein
LRHRRRRRRRTTTTTRTSKASTREKRRKDKKGGFNCELHKQLSSNKMGKREENTEKIQEKSDQ